MIFICAKFRLNLCHFHRAVVCWCICSLIRALFCINMNLHVWQLLKKFFYASHLLPQINRWIWFSFIVFIQYDFHFRFFVISDKFSLPKNRYELSLQKTKEYLCFIWLRIQDRHWKEVTYTSKKQTTQKINHRRCIQRARPPVLDQQANDELSICARREFKRLKDILDTTSVIFKMQDSRLICKKSSNLTN